MKRPRPTQLISPMCASRFSGVGIPTIYRWIRRGYIPTTVISVLRIKVKLKDIAAHIEKDPRYQWRRRAGVAARKALAAKRLTKRNRQVARGWAKQEPPP